MVGIYFSGTGNTRYLVRLFLDCIPGNHDSYTIEDPQAPDALFQEDEILFAYPIYYSNLPAPVRDFMVRNAALWTGKRIYILTTMGLFSGDGTGVGARLLKRYGACITGGSQVKMPDCISDVRLLKKPLDTNRRTVRAAQEKVRHASLCYQSKHPAREGLSLFAHMAGLFGQRLWFSPRGNRRSSALKIDGARCSGCGLCTRLCPVDNLTLEQNTAAAHGSCAMCYRCINHCPKQAITLLGKHVIEQSVIEKYLS